ncbi:eva-1 homolog Bb isoform X2 [Hoplias malabaricus]|uniref:eva-1 homolog Bb isoform X2 n=1 Tax=Hoplias malabaricus TaxID=27720 RepID=UPI0034618F8B
MNPVKKDMELLSNSMATYVHIKDNMESFALYFMLGVCFGLLLALMLLILGITCKPRPAKKKSATGRKKPREPRDQDQDQDEAEEEEIDGREVDDDDEGAMPKDTVMTVSEQSQRNGTLRSESVFSSAEELERARRLEERERIIREIWRNGQPDILVTGTGTLGRVHYR